MTASPTTTAHSGLAVWLAFIAGFVDTLGFVALFGLFTAHVTGNFVLIGAALAKADGHVLLKLLVFPAFVAAVACTRLAVLHLQRTQRPALRPLLLLQGALLAGFAGCGWLAGPTLSDAAPLALAAGILGAAAMGVQNAVARLLLPTLTPTTVMTGNVTQLVIDAVDLLRGGADPAQRARGARLLWPILAFAAGATAGAFGYVLFGFAALLVPLCVLVVLAARTRADPAA